MKLARAILFVFCAISLISGLDRTVLAMTSTNFSIPFDSVNGGGRDDATSTNFKLFDTIGEQATGDSTSTNFQIKAGYRSGDFAVTTLSFSIGTQQNSTKTAYSAYSTSSLTVTVASTAGYSTSSLIAVVENEGLAEIVAIGKITELTPTVITVDAWDGSFSLLSATSSGGDDFVYQLGGTGAELGTLLVGGNTSITGTQVSSDAASGFTVYVSDDGDLRSGSASIANVADGAVTASSEEYGFRVFGTTATSTGQDIPFATSTREVQKMATTASDKRVALVYKAAIASGTVSGSYAHVVYYTLTVNY